MGGRLRSVEPVNVFPMIFDKCFINLKTPGKGCFLAITFSRKGLMIIRIILVLFMEMVR